MSMKTAVKNVKSPWVLLPLFVLVTGFLATLWFFHNFEKKEYTITTGSSPQARNNLLLAAQEYLQQSGHYSESVKGLDILTKLPPVNDAIIIRYLPVGLSNSIVSDLFAWVEQGGHLIVQPNFYSLESSHPGKTTFFEQLGVDILKENSECGCPEKDDENRAEDNSKKTQENVIDQPGQDTQQRPSHYLLNADLYGNSIQLETMSPDLLKDSSNSSVFKIDGSYSIVFENEEDKLRGDQNNFVEREGAWLLQYRLGTGKVTVLSEMHLFNNYNIGKYDHAYFLSWLTQNDAAIWLLYTTEVDSFLKILWKKVPLFWLAFGVLLFLIIWRMQMQSGSQLRPALTERHNILHHIDATAQYNWRTNKLISMVNKNRKVVWNMVIGRKMGIQEGPQNTDIDIPRLAQKTGMTEKQMHTAFRQAIETEQDLIQTSIYMHRLNMHMSGGEKKKNDKS